MKSSKICAKFLKIRSKNGQKYDIWEEYSVFYLFWWRFLNWRWWLNFLVEKFSVVSGNYGNYPRSAPDLKASDNNRAETVLQEFLNGVEEFGLPSRVRSDKGGENVDVSAYMLSHPQRGPGRGSMITGL